MNDHTPVQALQEAATPGRLFSLACAPNFPELLAKIGGAIALTTHQAGRLAFLGLMPDGRLSLFSGAYPRCTALGLSADGKSMLLASDYQVVRLDNILPPGVKPANGADARFAPHRTWVTGDIGIHDIAFDRDERPVFVNSQFNCIATVSDSCNFKPVWMPPFISGLVREDRCHLNGIAVQKGVVRYATALATTDSDGGWKAERARGGVLIDVASREIVAANLSMPHSPRLHAGRVWLLNSGTGEVGHVDPRHGKFNPVAFLPGFVRGLAFARGYAIVGMSLPRSREALAGLPLEGRLDKCGENPFCGLVLIDMATGDIASWVHFDGLLREVYEVAVVPGSRLPAIIGLGSDETRNVITAERPDPEVLPPRKASRIKQREVAAVL